MILNIAKFFIFCFVLRSIYSFLRIKYLSYSYYEDILKNKKERNSRKNRDIDSDEVD